jgi:hypothetical protein
MNIFKSPFDSKAHEALNRLRVELKSLAIVHQGKIVSLPLEYEWQEQESMPGVFYKRLEKALPDTTFDALFVNLRNELIHAQIRAPYPITIHVIKGKIILNGDVIEAGQVYHLQANEEHAYETFADTYTVAVWHYDQNQEPPTIKVYNKPK